MNKLNEACKIAKETAERYCKEKGYSLQLLQHCYRQTLEDKFIYYIFENNDSNGLINEINELIENPPIIVLEITSDYSVLETEATRKYFEQ